MVQAYLVTHERAWPPRDTILAKSWNADGASPLAPHSCSGAARSCADRCIPLCIRVRVPPRGCARAVASGFQSGCSQLSLHPRRSATAEYDDRVSDRPGPADQPVGRCLHEGAVTRPGGHLLSVLECSAALAGCALRGCFLLLLLLLLMRALGSGTQNAFPGAPVQIGRALLASDNYLGAVVINNKISNVCARGDGVADAETSERFHLL
eukprot:COSAG05_NODE_599_length_8442_cov_52.187268_8_plen_209_part_00